MAGRLENTKIVLGIFNLFSNKAYFKDSSNKYSHLREAMISRRLSKLMRFIVNNLMLNLESPHVPLWRAPKLLEVHLPQFGNSGTTYNMLFSAEGKKTLKRSRGLISDSCTYILCSKTTQVKSDSFCFFIQLENSPIY